MIPDWFVFVAIGFNFVGIIGYVAAVLRGRARPNRVTFALWALAPLIAFAAEVQEGVGIRSLLTLAVGLGPLFVLGASYISRQAEWEITRFDLVCGALSLVGLALWIVSGDGNVAIAFAIAADGLAALPTVRKSYLDPDSEHAPAYGCAFIASGITLLTVGELTFAAVAFPLYLLAINGLIIALVVSRIGLRRAPLAERVDS